METKKIALLRPCTSERYGQLCEKMFSEFLNFDLSPVDFSFNGQNEPESGHDAQSKKISEIIDKEKRYHFVLEDFDVQKGKFPERNRIKEYDGVLITGSICNAYDNDPWILDLVDFIHFLLEENVKTVGICFGHQIIGRAIGGSVRRNPKGPQDGNVDLVFTEDAKEFVAKLLEGKVVDKVNFIYTHNDEVFALPFDRSEIEILNMGGNLHTPYHGLIIRKKLNSGGKYNLLTFQGHPEYLTRGGSLSLQRQRDKCTFVSDKAKDEFVESCKNANFDDAAILAKVITNFLLN